MSSETYETTIKTTAKLIRETAVDVAWRQWGALGAGTSASSGERAEGVLDPEALVLVSVTVRDAERRLEDLVGWWASVGSRLLSVQRMRTLAETFPAATADGLGAFARLAEAAGDRRWRRYASETEPTWAKRGRKGPGMPRLHEASALMVRLRAGFGVNAKADALAFLLGIEGAASVQAIAEAIGYTKVAARNALKDMVLARLIRETAERPAQYYVDPTPWAGVLGLEARGEVRWGYWASVHAFLAHAHVLYERDEPQSAYVVSTHARDLVARFGGALVKHGVTVPREGDYRGAAYLEAFREVVEGVAKAR